MSDVLRVGVVGTGAIGRAHIDRINNALQGAKVVACSDVNVEFGKSVAEKYGCRFYEDGEAMIASDEVDAVVVTTIDEFHEKYVMAAVKAGKFVMCEKPLAPKAEACKRIMEAEMAGGRHLVQVGFMRRYDPGYNQLKKLLDSGEYGEALMVHCCHRNATCPDYTTTAMSVENTMIHEIDVMRWLLGEEYEEVEVVFPKASRKSTEILRDPQIMYLTTKSGVRIDVEAFVKCGYGYDIKCEVCCGDGTLNLPEPANAMIRTNASRVTPICKDWSERFPEAYNIEFQAWINACKEDRVDGPTAWDGYVGQVTASTASIARDTQTKQKIVIGECPAFYQK